MSKISLIRRDEIIVVHYAHKNKQFRVSTRVRIEDQYWDEDHVRKNHPDFSNVDKMIKVVFARVVNASLAVNSRGLEPSALLVREEYNRIITPKKPVEVEFWLKYQQYRDQLNCRDTTKVNHEVTFNHLKDFEEYAALSLSVEILDKVVFGQFIQYLLLKLGMRDSTINRNVRFFKAFLHWAYPEKNFTWMKYTLMNIDEEVIALYEYELQQLIDTEVGGYLEKTKDLFVFLATSGMRYSDSQLFDPTWVSKEQIMEFSQRKTGGMAYAPMSRVAAEIVRKYGGLPPQISKNKFNDYLKDLFEELKLTRPVKIKTIKGKQVYTTVSPLSDVISSHTARRTFITLCLEKGMPIQDVMKMSGHSDYKSMKPYIRVTKQHLRNVADKWDI